MRGRVFLGMGVLAVLALAAGCACEIGPKKASPVVEPTPAPAAVKAAPAATGAGLATKDQQALALKGEPLPAVKLSGTPREPVTEEEKQVFGMIHFDFDRSDIRDDARPVLEKIGAYLKKNPAVKISIEGNCDERGTEEYNMALGERRALSARRYLVSLGISPDRLGTVSYGKDKPLDPGHNEAAWAMNRNCQFKIVE